MSSLDFFSSLLYTNVVLSTGTIMFRWIFERDGSIHVEISSDCSTRMSCRQSVPQERIFESFVTDLARISSTLPSNVERFVSICDEPFLTGFWDRGRVCGDRSVFVTSHRPAHSSCAHAFSLDRILHFAFEVFFYLHGSACPVLITLLCVSIFATLLRVSILATAFTGYCL